jgi:hypothetical protein
MMLIVKEGTRGGMSTPLNCNDALVVIVCNSRSERPSLAAMTAFLGRTPQKKEAEIILQEHELKKVRVERPLFPCVLLQVDSTEPQ